LFELCGHSLFCPKDYARGDLNYTTFLAALDHLRIEQVLGRLENRLARASGFASSRELVPEAVSLQ
jgi:hypothetical protein